MANSQYLPIIAIRGRVVFPHTSVTFDVGRSISLAALKMASKTACLFVCAQRDSAKDEIDESDIYPVGTVVAIRQISKLPGGNARLQCMGLYRAVARDISFNEGTFTAIADELVCRQGDPGLVEAYMRTVRACEERITDGGEGVFTPSVTVALKKITDADEYVDVCANAMKIPFEGKQKILECPVVTERLAMLNSFMENEIEIMGYERKIKARVRESVDKNQKEYYLREQLKAIHAELGDDGEETDELEEKILSSDMPEEVKNKALKELSRMSRMQTSSPDYNVIRIYLDWLLDLPWTNATADTAKLSDAVKILNKDHYGLEKIKKRITEYIAVLQRTGGVNAPILCFVGPPGVGKTSVASSIARALGRKFVRMSLGGVRDEAEIRGHRKTYVGAMPGRIIAGMKKAGTVNPVFLFDEVDKISADMRGDPADALLEVLDPAQNNTFQDRYLEVPYDLSRVLFITTANTLETIPAPLRDRMEIIELGGYTHEEKAEIAKRYLIPKKLQANGLTKSELSISEGALNTIIECYTMEAGVRNLERKIDALCRRAAVELADGKIKKFSVTEKNLEDILGAKRYDKDEKLRRDEVGAACGLAWTAYGGATLIIEVSKMQGKGEVLLTGKLGDVMKESARAAISYIRSNCEDYGIDVSAFETTDIHVHVPEGATPKDGPSAGITMACAILSAFTGKPVKSSVAMTGEITLRGKVLPIGGLKEKALAAYRTGIRNVIIPEDNERDLDEIPQTVRENINFIPVSDVDTVFRNAIVGM